MAISPAQRATSTGARNDAALPGAEHRIDTSHVGDLPVAAAVEGDAVGGGGLQPVGRLGGFGEHADERVHHVDVVVVRTHHRGQGFGARLPLQRGEDLFHRLGRLGEFGAQLRGGAGDQFALPVAEVAEVHPRRADRVVQRDLLGALVVVGLAVPGGQLAAGAPVQHAQHTDERHQHRDDAAAHQGAQRHRHLPRRFRRAAGLLGAGLLGAGLVGVGFVGGVAHGNAFLTSGPPVSPGARR
ncbi:GNAT family N-acetyltransferase [Mycolicibacillus parakoreensis]|uniref:GNAT family N-acetyltransferase n=1 Tax=Mycolicibacillus parakoreensis TaxID=1069221 RepID=UPI0038990B66